MRAEAIKQAGAGEVSYPNLALEFLGDFRVILDLNPGFKESGGEDKFFWELGGNRRFTFRDFAFTVDYYKDSYTGDRNLGIMGQKLPLGVPEADKDIEYLLITSARRGPSFAYDAIDKRGINVLSLRDHPRALRAAVIIRNSLIV